MSLTSTIPQYLVAWLSLHDKLLIGAYLVVFVTLPSAVIATSPLPKMRQERERKAKKPDVDAGHAGHHRKHLDGTMSMSR